MNQLEIEWEIAEKSWYAYCDVLRPVIAKTLNHCDFWRFFENQKLCVGFFLVTEEYIRAINREYRQKDRTTNVLSFPYIRFNNGVLLDSDMPSGDVYLGDLFLSPNYIKRESVDFLQHISSLTVHGTLHLLGFTHDHEVDFKIMHSIERQIY